MTPQQQAQHDYQTGGTNPYPVNSREYVEYQTALDDLYQAELQGRGFRCIGCEE